MKTTLEIVQLALSAIDSDNVSSIDETVESEQVKDILDTVYEKLIFDYPWAHIKEVGSLEVTPTLHKMKLPNDIVQINSIRYNKKDVRYIPPHEMVTLLDSRDTTLDTVDQNGAVNNKDPRMWTSYDDTYIIFDSYNQLLVSRLSNCFYLRMPPLLISDLDKPKIPERLLPVLLDGVYEEAFRHLKGDEKSATVYQKKYISGLSKAKRWAKRINREDSTYGRDYARGNT